MRVGPNHVWCEGKRAFSPQTILLSLDRQYIPRRQTFSLSLATFADIPPRIVFEAVGFLVVRARVTQSPLWFLQIVPRSCKQVLPVSRGISPPSTVLGQGQMR